MDDKQFSELMESMKEMAAIRRGEILPARVTTFDENGNRTVTCPRRDAKQTSEDCPGTPE